MKWLLFFALLFWVQLSNAQCDNYQYQYSFDCNQNQEYPIDTFGLIIECTHPFVISIDGEFYDNYEINNANQTFNYYYNIENLIIETDFELIIYMPQFCIDTINIANECGSLPLELISFEAFNLHENNVINWQTASVVNEDFFILQSSENGIDFNELTKIPAINHSAGIKQYQYVDKLVNQTKYYRLLSQDDNGIKRIVSNVKMVNGNNYTAPTVFVNGKTVNVYPESLKWELYNATGKLLDVTNKGLFDLSNYSAGIYIINGNGFSVKIVNW